LYDIEDGAKEKKIMYKKIHKMVPVLVEYQTGDVNLEGALFSVN